MRTLVPAFLIVMVIPLACHEPVDPLLAPQLFTPSSGEVMEESVVGFRWFESGSSEESWLILDDEVVFTTTDETNGWQTTLERRDVAYEWYVISRIGSRVIESTERRLFYIPQLCDVAPIPVDGAETCPSLSRFSWTHCRDAVWYRVEMQVWQDGDWSDLGTLDVEGIGMEVWQFTAANGQMQAQLPGGDYRWRVRPAFLADRNDEFWFGPAPEWSRFRVRSLPLDEATVESPEPGSLFCEGDSFVPSVSFRPSDFEPGEVVVLIESAKREQLPAITAPWPPTIEVGKPGSYTLSILAQVEACPDFQAIVSMPFGVVPAGSSDPTLTHGACVESGSFSQLNHTYNPDITYRFELDCDATVDVSLMDDSFPGVVSAVVTGEGECRWRVHQEAPACLAGLSDESPTFVVQTSCS